MIKLLFLIILFHSFVFGSVKDINNKIKSNKRQFDSVVNKKDNINKNLYQLAKRINDEEKSYNKIVEMLELTNTKLLLNRIKLSESISKVNNFKKKSLELSVKKEDLEKSVIDFVIEKYAMSMGIEQAKKESLEDVVGKEVYSLVFDNAREEILDLNIEYLKINNTIRDNEKRIAELNSFISEQKGIKSKYTNLEISQEKKLESLKTEHRNYQKNLQKMVDKQNKITDLLGSLNILKKKEIKKEEERIRKAKALALKKEKERKRRELAAKKALEKERLASIKKGKKTKQIKLQKRKDLDKEIDIEVKKIGSSAKGIKISKYTGAKTIAPLKSYTITKKFGKYYDEVYKMELFNESVALKTKIPNAKVLSVFKGQVVYAKENSGLLAKVVIVKHKNNLHTIYSHLDQISPTLKVGKWIPKGYVVGRVSDTLEFQATKNSKYIDPMKLVK